MNREPDIYSDFNIVSDPFHEPNHTTCSDSFKSTKNPKFLEKNVNYIVISVESIDKTVIILN